MTEKNFYKILSEDPTTEYSDIVNCTIENFKKPELLCFSTAKKLTTDDVRTRHVHILLKLYQPNILARPIVSSVEYDTSKISEFVDHYLKPYPEVLPSYISSIKSIKQTHIPKA